MAARLIAALLAVALVATAAPAAERPAQLRLHVLDCGRFEGLETAQFLPGVTGEPARMDRVNRCYLVDHPRGRLLWDTGLPTSRSAKAMAWLHWFWTLGRTGLYAGPSLTTQLAELGLTPADVDYLALSHVHLDHAGNANLFAGSTWLVQRAEREWAFSPDLDESSVWPSFYRDLRTARTQELDGDHDVFGDGRVVILSTPGHTPGHQSLLLLLPETGPVVLSGDLYHSTRNRTLRLPPAFNVDPDLTRRSMERIERLVAERGAQLWIQHEPGSGPAAPALVE